MGVRKRGGGDYLVKELQLRFGPDDGALQEMEVVLYSDEGKL